jgi:hypothetical protein
MVYDARFVKNRHISCSDSCCNPPPSPPDLGALEDKELLLLDVGPQ